MNELWLPIPGLSHYEASSEGRIRSLTRKVYTTGGRNPNGRWETHPGKILSQHELNSGYLSVTVSESGRRKRRTVHSLIALAFVGPRPEGQDVMHVDGDRKNNRPENLRYGTRSENLRQAYDYGGTHGVSKLSLEDVDAIRARLADGEPRCRVAPEYGMSESGVKKIQRGESFAWYKGGAACGA